MGITFVFFTNAIIACYPFIYIEKNHCVIFHQDFNTLQWSGYIYIYIYYVTNILLRNNEHYVNSVLILQF
jgi:hypothetical protein